MEKSILIEFRRALKRNVSMLEDGEFYTKKEVDDLITKSYNDGKKRAEENSIEDS